MKIRELMTKINDTIRPPHVKGPGGGGGSPDAVDDALAAGVGKSAVLAPGTYSPDLHETRSDE